MEFLQALFISILTGLVCGLVAWGGIKRDVFWLGERVKEAKETATRAHMRIDDLIKRI